MTSACGGSSRRSATVQSDRRDLGGRSIRSEARPDRLFAKSEARCETGGRAPATKSIGRRNGAQAKQPAALAGLAVIVVAGFGMMMARSVMVDVTRADPVMIVGPQDGPGPVVGGQHGGRRQPDIARRVRQGGLPRANATYWLTNPTYQQSLPVSAPFTDYVRQPDQKLPLWADADKPSLNKYTRMVNSQSN